MRLLQSFFFFTQIGHVRYISFLTCSEALGIKLQLFKVYFVSKFPKETGYKEDSTKYGCLS